LDGSDISVVICTRDRPEALRSCLRSVAGSTRRPCEVVVVDQSSDGHTAEVIEKFSAASPFPLRYLHLDTVGHTKARNAGIRASRGQIIAFTDDDCVVDAGWLDAVSREFARSPANCVCGQTRPASHQERPRPALLSTLNHHRRRLVRGKHNPITVGRGNNMAFRKDDLVRLGGFNEQIGVGTSVYAGDDLDLFYRLLEAGGSIMHAPDAIVLHAQPDDWETVVRKKRGYAISAAAVLAGRARYGDLYAGVLLGCKILYEFGYLLCGGALRLNPRLAAIGWHSLLGSLSGLKYLLNGTFCDEARRLTRSARESRAPRPRHV